MNLKVPTRPLLGLVLLAVGAASVSGGDSTYGKVIAVKSADLLIFDYGAGRYEIRPAGIVVLSQFAETAKARVVEIALGKNARVRLVRRVGDTMIAQVRVNDRDKGRNDVALDLLKKGYARRQTPAQPDTLYLYKYGELALAEAEGKTALSARTPPAAQTPQVTAIP